MSLYPAYLEELRGQLYIELPYGFTSYILYPDGVCMLCDTYIRPEERGKGLSQALFKMVEVLAKAAGCDKLIATTSLDIKDPSTSAAILLKYGFKIKESSKVMLLFSKEI